MKNKNKSWVYTAPQLGTVLSCNKRSTSLNDSFLMVLTELPKKKKNFERLITDQAGYMAGVTAGQLFVTFCL
jgi:hypothetical protein